MDTNNTKRPAAFCPRYLIAALKRLLSKHGHLVARKSGVYRPFWGNTQASTEGFTVRKLGCSKSVVVDYTLGHERGTWHDYKDGASNVRKTKIAECLALLQAAGYTLDASYAGIKIDCQHYDC